MLLFDKDHGPNVEPRTAEDAPLMLRRLAPRADEKLAPAPIRVLFAKHKKVVVFDSEKNYSEAEGKQGIHSDVMAQKLADAGYEVTRVLRASQFSMGFVKTPPARVPTPVFRMLKKKATTGTPYNLRVIRDAVAAPQMLKEIQPDAILIDQFFYANRADGRNWAEMVAQACPAAKVILQEQGSVHSDCSWVEKAQESAMAPAYVTVRPTRAAIDEIAHYLNRALSYRALNR